MKVITNGFPKSGNHALVKAVQLLGQPCKVTHEPSAAQASGKAILIKRDPRNIICSWLRFNGQPVTEGMFLTAFRHFQTGHFVDEMTAYEGWLALPFVHKVRYEDLIANDAAMRGVAEYLGVPYIEGAFEDLPGLTRTWYAEHSDYRSIWTPEVEAAWNAEGGAELLARWGY